MKILPSEKLLTGKWLVKDGTPIADDTSHRINALIDSYLMELGRDESGWDVLYRDPLDGRLWELTYPESELHGGGPPQLRYMDLAEARQKFGSSFTE